jgi:predicted HAD superfamily Cof-like phosphohydrolase
MRWIRTTREGKVAEFLQAADKTPWLIGGQYELSYENNLKEEQAELREAMQRYVKDPSEKNRAELCKEWADVQVVLSNIAVYFDIPADPAFNRVHENNMTKVVDGKLRIREDGKILKPEGYVKPDMRGL